MSAPRSPSLFERVVAPVADRIVAPVVDAVDPDALLARVDLDELLQRIDLDAVLARVDLGALLDRLDLNAVLARIDVAALLDRIDTDAVVRRVDVDAVVGRVDVDAVVRRVDVDAVVSRVDVDALVQRIDVNAVVERVHVANVVGEGATQIVTGTRDRVHTTIARADRAVLHVCDRMLRRDADAMSALPYAGPVSRLGAWIVDSFAISASFSVLVAVGGYLAGLFSGGRVDATPDGSLWWIAAGACWWLLYFFVCYALDARTPGMALAGIRVARGDDDQLRARQALVRALVLPLSFIGGLGFVGIVLGRRRRGLHDVAAGTVVVSVAPVAPRARSRP